MWPALTSTLASKTGPRPRSWSRGSGLNLGLGVLASALTFLPRLTLLCPTHDDNAVCTSYKSNDNNHSDTTS